MNNGTSKTVALLVISLANFIMPLMGSAVSVALPSISNELRADAIELSWVVAAFTLSAALFFIPLGRVADIVGIKKIFIWGMSIYTASAVLSALSTSTLMLIISRAVQGAGLAMAVGTSLALLISVFRTGDKGKAIGITTAAVYSGLSVGPFLGGILTAYLGWRSIFILNVPLGLIIVGLTLWKIKGEWAEAKGEKFDFIGSTIYGVTIILIMYGLSLLPAITGGVLIVAGVVALLAFIKWEGRVTSPVLNIELFRNNKVLAFSNLAALISYSATFALTFLLSLYLQYIKGFSPQIAGLILVAQPVFQTIVSPFAGRLSDKVTPQKLAAVGIGLNAVGLFPLAFLSENTPLTLLIIYLVILGIGFGLFSSPNTNAVMSSIEQRHYGVASATLGTMRSVGMMLSIGISMVLFAIYMGRVEITPEYYPHFLTSVRIAFAIFAVMCLGGIFASLVSSRQATRTVSSSQ